MLKFFAIAVGNTDPKTTFLADGNLATVAPNAPFAYPIASSFTFVSFATELLTTYNPDDSPGPPFIVPVGGLVTFQVLHSGVAVPAFTITYGPGEGGVKSLSALVELFAVGDTFDVQMQTSGFHIGDVSVAAAIGIRAS